MKVLVKKTTVLELNTEEAEWLKAMTQNSLVPPEQEGDKDRRIRSRFWQALNKEASSHEYVIRDEDGE